MIETLTPAELARQLANPDGAVGLAVANWLNLINKQAIAKSVSALRVEAGARVLAIGFGNGCAAREVIGPSSGCPICGHRHFANDGCRSFRFQRRPGCGRQGPLSLKISGAHAVR